MRKIKCSVLFLLLFTEAYCNNDDATYKISITQIDTAFKINLTILIPNTDVMDDTLLFSFGGIVPSYSVSELQIKSGNNRWSDFNQEKRELRICKKDIINHTLQFDYSFNPVWGAMFDTTVVVFGNNVEYPIPAMHGIDTVRMLVDILPRNDWYILSNIPINNAHPTKIDLKQLLILFLDQSLCKQIAFTVPYPVYIHTADPSLTNDDLNRLEKKINDCLKYFSTHIAPYRHDRLDIVKMNWYGSTYQGGLAIVNNSDFKTYTLFHELAHEWIGGMIPVKEGCDGEFLLRESLNEYLNTQFLRHEEGDSLYHTLIDKYTKLYADFLKEHTDTSIMSIKKYAHTTHPLIIYKQVVLLDKLANSVGYETLNTAIFGFLRSRIGQLTETAQFLTFLQETYGARVEDYLKAI